MGVVSEPYFAYSTQQFYDGWSRRVQRSVNLRAVDISLALVGDLCCVYSMVCVCGTGDWFINLAYLVCTQKL